MSRCTYLAKIFSIVFALFFAGCQLKFEASDLTSSGSDILSGSINGYSSIDGSNKPGSLSSCQNDSVKLYSLNSLGQKDALLAEGNVDPSGHFEISGLRALNIDLDQSFTSTNYFVEFVCGNTTYQRFVTGPEDQIISAGTSLIAWLSSTEVGSQISNQNLDTWKSLYTIIEDASSQTAAFSTLNSNPQLKSKFQQSFGIEPTVLLNATPQIRASSVPKVFPEGTSQAVNVQAIHWSPDYDIAYEWKMGTESLSQASNFSFLPNANSQGAYTLQLFVGRDDGAGGVDTTKPYLQKAFDIVISNTQPPTVPEITLISDAYTTSTSVQLQLTTGSLVDGRPQHCKSFTSLAVVEESFPGTGMWPLSSSAYNIDCTNDDTQTLNLTLSGTEGSRSITLWSKDAAGNISATPETLSVFYDITNPVVTLTSLNSSENLKGGSSFDLTWTATDLASKPNSVSLEYSADNGSNWTNITSGISNSGTYSWTLPALNSSQMLVRVSMDDLAGNSGSDVSSSSFTIDSTKPSTPTMTLSSSTPSTDTGVDLSVTCDADYHKVLISTSSSTPTAQTAGWQDCSANMSAVVSTGDGAKNIYIWSMDLVGNISSSSDSVSMTLDQTPPAFAFTAVPSTDQMGSDVTSIGFSVSEAHITSAKSFSISYSIDNGVNWTSAGTVSSTDGPLSNESFSYNLTLPAANSEQVKVKLSGEDTLGNSSNIISDAFTVDSLPPVLTAVTINDGAESTGFSFLSMKVNGTDNLTGFSKVRFADTISSAECQSLYADSGWMPWTDTTTPLSYNMTAVDGSRKICAWAQDSVGNVSVIDPTMGTLGVDSNVIDYFVGNPPVVSGLSITNSLSGTTFTTGETVYISWSLTDAEGLPTSPLDIYVSVNGGAWTQVEKGVGNLTGQPTTGSDTYTGYTAPSGVFRIKVVATDTNGNTSVPALSSVMNSFDWSVYMGSSEKGVGGKGTSLTMFKMTYGAAANQFAMNPVNGDIYAVSSGENVYKLDAQTGQTSVFIKHGNSNFSDGMVVENMVANTTMMEINFDPTGRLYISNPEGISSSSQNGVKIWQVDFENDTISHYAGGGLEPGESLTMPASALSLSVGLGAYDIDDSGSIYFFSDCDSSTYVSATPTLRQRILKLTQNPDGTAGSTELIAGDCGNGDPLNDAAATESGLGSVRYRHIKHIAVNSDGTLIYVSDSGINPGTYKVVYDTLTAAYKIYHTSIGSKGLVFDRFHNQLFAATGAVWKVSLATDPADAETMSTYISSSGTGDCDSDGVSAASACINAYGSNGWAPLEMASDGTLLFTDNLFRIRYIDSNSELRTLMGSQPFYGEGLHRSMARGVFSGIHYKTSNLNTTDYPKGLYFVERDAGVFGYVDPLTDTVSIVAGNQQQLSTFPSNGTAVDKFTNMGYKGNTNFEGLTFNSDGFPVIQANNTSVVFGAGKTITSLSSGHTHWFTAADNSSLSELYFPRFWSSNNLVAIGTNYVYGMGVNNTTTLGDFKGGLAFMDITASSLKYLMKGISTSSGAASPDSTTPSVVNASPLAGSCYHTLCFLQYNSIDGNLYFSEGSVIRKITSPTDPTSVTLTSPADLSMGRAVYNFIFSPDNKRVYYLSSSSLLYCKWIDASTAPANCDNSSLGPGVGFSLIPRLPNQMTFIEDGKLLISNGAEIYQYSYTP